MPFLPTVHYLIQNPHTKLRQNLTPQIHQLHRLLLKRHRLLKLLSFQTQTLERKHHHMQAFPRLEGIQYRTKETRLVGEVELVEARVFGGRFERLHWLHYEVEF